MKFRCFLTAWPLLCRQQTPLFPLPVTQEHNYAEPISFPKVVGADCPHTLRLSVNEDAHFKFSFGNKAESLQK